MRGVLTVGYSPFTVSKDPLKVPDGFFGGFDAAVSSQGSFEGPPNPANAHISWCGWGDRALPRFSRLVSTHHPRANNATRPPSSSLFRKVNLLLRNSFFVLTASGEFSLFTNKRVPVRAPPKYASRLPNFSSPTSRKPNQSEPPALNLFPFLYPPYPNPILPRRTASQRRATIPASYTRTSQPLFFFL